MDKQYITNIHMEFRGKWYRPGDMIPASVLGLQRNINFLLSRGRIQEVEAGDQIPAVPVPVTAPQQQRAPDVSEPPKRGGRPRKASA